MIKKITLVFFVLFAFSLTSVQGQASTESQLDSLEAELAKDNSDSIEIRLLLGISIGNQYSNFDRAKQFADRAVEMAEKENLNWAKSISYSQQAFLATLRGDYTTALKYDNMRLPITIALKDSAQIARTVNNLGDNYFRLGEYDESYYYFTQSFRISQAIKDSVQSAVAIYNVGTVFKELGQFDIALNHLEISLKMSEKAGDLDGPAFSHDEIGDVYLRKGEYGKAREYLLKSLTLTRARQINILEPVTLTKLARLSLEEGDYASANAYYDSAHMLNGLTHNELGKAESRLGKGEVSLKQGKFAEANLLITEALQSARTMNARTLEIQGLRVLADLHEKQGDFKKSLAYLKEFNTLQDSLFSQDMQEKLFQGQLRFETENKDLQIAALSRTQAQQADEMKRQDFIRNILVVVVALTVILLFTVYRSGQRRIKINKLLIEHQDEVKRRSIELEQLNQVKDKFFSIISHDLRSPINALAGILDLMDKDQITPQEFSKVSKELRVQFNHTKTLINNLLDWALLQMDKLKIQASKIDLHKLVEENFKMLRSIQLKDIDMVNEIPAEQFALADVNMINLVFRNLILNSIKFTESGGRIKVSSTTENDHYVISVSDNGVGINPEVQKILFEKTSGYSTRGTANEKGTGLGLILCKEFIERNGGKIWLESEPGKGSTFFFTIKRFS